MLTTEEIRVLDQRDEHEADLAILPPPYDLLWEELATGAME